jgi:magnesium chelatase family protein
MLASARTFTHDGVVVRPIRVEVDIHRGPPRFSLTGPEPSARETQERIRAAVVNCGFDFPHEHAYVNLAPASLRWPKPLGLDLPVAVAFLVASRQLQWFERLSQMAIIGELALDGSVRPVPGVPEIAEAARANGLEAIAVSAENATQAVLVRGIDIVALENLHQIIALTTSKERRGG